MYEEAATLSKGEQMLWQSDEIESSQRENERALSGGL